jgi:hypothetical protein
MDSAAEQGTGGVASDAGLADLSEKPLVDVLSVVDDESPLGRAMRRVRAAAENGAGTMSAFGSFIKAR